MEKRVTVHLEGGRSVEHQLLLDVDPPTPNKPKPNMGFRLRDK